MIASLNVFYKVKVELMERKYIVRKSKHLAFRGQSIYLLDVET